MYLFINSENKKKKNRARESTCIWCVVKMYSSSSIVFNDSFTADRSEADRRIFYGKDDDNNDDDRGRANYYRDGFRYL